jgi:hypothetical protein
LAVRAAVAAWIASGLFLSFVIPEPTLNLFELGVDGCLPQTARQVICLCSVNLIDPPRHRLQRQFQLRHEFEPLASSLILSISFSTLCPKSLVIKE